MKFSEIVAQTLTWLQRDRRVSYRALKLEFDLDDDTLDALKEEIIDAKRLARDENGKVLVWTGQGNKGETEKRGNGEGESLAVNHTPPPAQHSVLNTQHSAVSERRQITVLFCDLVGSTALSTQLDPEDYQTLVQAYHQTCADVIHRHEGYIAQPLGDGVLVYFGYPTAHEDDARRAIRTGLEIIEAVRTIPLPQETKEARTLQVRIGVHTGLVVVGEIGSGEKREMLALGETPNLAARIQGLAEPNTVLMSAATQRLVDQQFESQPFGSHLLKGFTAPIAVYHVQSERQHVSPLGGKETLTPLVGREQEVGLLLDRWEQTKEGRGQVLLLSGEPGIGKSRLTLTLKEQVTNDGSLLYEARCSPYHQHSALYPLIEGIQRTLLFTRQDTEEQKVAKLAQVLTLYDMQDRLPLFTALLSLPTPAQAPLSHLTPQRQKERTFQALLQLMAAQAERQATVSVWEDLHWADPSSLEFLSLLIEQIPTTKLLLVLTFRPEFRPPWSPRSHLSQLVLNRLGKKQVEAMIAQAAGTQLSPEVIEQIRLKTDGVPLFVEEVTKSVIESVEGQQVTPLQLAIPATLQEALLARLDRLSEARQVAQLGATLGREFSHELLQAVSPLHDTDLHAALTKLVEAEILYQRGAGEQARYFFKHALIQDTAYQSLLKSTRVQYHQHIARTLEERFPDSKANQPELLAHHYTEANLIEQAIPYWQQAGEQAMQRSAHIETEHYLAKGIALVQSLPESTARVQQEALLQIRLGHNFFAKKGPASPEVGAALTRASLLCEHLGDSAQLFAVSAGLRAYWNTLGETRKSLEQAERMLQIAQHTQDAGMLLQAHMSLGVNYCMLGEFSLAQNHLEKALSFHDPQLHRSLVSQYGYDPTTMSLTYSCIALWFLGRSDQAQQKSAEALTFARELSHSMSLGGTFLFSLWFCCLSRKEQDAATLVEESLSFAREYNSEFLLAVCPIFKGRTLLFQGKAEEGLQIIQETLSLLDAFRTQMYRSEYLSYLAQGYAAVGRIDDGLAALDQALAFAEKHDERYYEAELYRLKGELTLQQFRVLSSESQVPNPQPLTPNTQAEADAEACFRKAIAVAQKQQAKSWELRASTSLARLWQRQGKQAEAHTLLSEIYHWFTEGFDTKDLQEAKALLEELSR